MSKRIITVEQIGYKVGSAASATLVSCVGKLEFTVESTAKSKKCGASEEIVAVTNNGTGDINIDAHGDNADYEEMLGMSDTANKMAVNKRGAKRPKVCITAYGTDEDGAKVVLAFPKAMITQDSSTFSYDNGSNEVPYLSQALRYAPDANGIGVYIKDEADLPSGKTVDNWMSAFDASTMAK